MIAIRSAAERGHADHGWLDTYHTFSFADYYDPDHMGFSVLRVINEDRVAGGAGFPTHPHRDMEIVTYVLEGALEHRDSMGTGSVIRAGDVQRMSAGAGVAHSEYNASRTDPVHFLQIWIIPAERGIEPSYEQQRLPEGCKAGKLVPVAGPAGAGAALTLHQDASIHATELREGQSVAYTLARGRRAWVQAVRGTALVNGRGLRAGDGLAIEDEQELLLVAPEFAELLLFDLP